MGKGVIQLFVGILIGVFIVAVVAGAYYSKFVPCGLSINCPSHEPIEVEVSAGETVTGVDPQDWYNPQ